MNIVLIGYRGTGKSVVGKIIADRLNMNRAVMDEMIVEKAGILIPEIVEKFGWTKFRDLESEIARNLSESDNLVIDTGGGVIERPENMEALGANALVFWLKASVETIVARIAEDTQRPALTKGKTFTEEIAQVLETRSSKYRRAAQYEIDTDELTPDQTAERIVEIYKKTV